MNGRGPKIAKTALGIVLWATSGYAWAQADPSRLNVSGEVTLASDYRFRGVSFSRGQPAAQAGVELDGTSGWFAGLWGSVSRDQRWHDSELDIYVGRAGTTGRLDYSLSVYAYSDGDLRQMSYAELRTTLSHMVGPASLELEVSASTREAAGAPRNLYLGLTSRTAIGPKGLTLITHAGRENGFFSRKIDWEVGAAYSRGPWTGGASFTGCTRCSGVPGEPPSAAPGRRGAALLVSLTRSL